MTNLAKSPLLWNNNSLLDVFFKDYFNSDSMFDVLDRVHIKNPVDFYTTTTGLHINIALAGARQEDVSVLTENGILRVKYVRPVEDLSEEDRNYLIRNISRKAFDHGWKITSKYDLSSVEASLDNGMLYIFIPLAESAKPLQIEIKTAQQLLS